MPTTLSAVTVKRITAFCLRLLSVLLVLLPLSFYALETGSAEAGQKTVVRVGWFDSPYYMMDRFGRRSGYAYEYQQKIAPYAGWIFEYVEGSWPELMEKLERGEIDLMSDVSYTRERSRSMLFSALPMGEEEYYTFISARSNAIQPDDYGTLNGKKVGVNKGSVQKEYFIEWEKLHGITAEIVELTGSEKENLQKLEQGGIDAYVTIDAFGVTGNCLPVSRVGSSSVYFAVSKNRPDLKRDLDSAMSRIQNEDRNYTRRLFEKYVESTGANAYLSSSERDWLQHQGMIRVGYRDDYLPFSAQDKQTGKLTGALKDYLDLASNAAKNARVYFNPMAYPSVEALMTALQNGEVDCVFPASLSVYDAENTGVILTDPIMHTEMFAVVRAADRNKFDLRGALTAGMSIGNFNHETFVKDHFPDWNIAFFNNTGEGLKAVASGQADCFLISNYRINKFEDLLEKYKLTPFNTGEDMSFSFALRRDENTLLSILNSTGRLVPEAAVNAALASYTYEGKKASVEDFLADHLAAVIAIAAIIAAVILFLLWRSERAKKDATESQELISAAERDKLSGLFTRNFFNEYVGRLHGNHPDWKMDAIVLNVEQFHSVNELNGREFGDSVLRTLGREIKLFLNETWGIAGRIEADRFVIYCKQPVDYQSLLNRLQSRLDGLSRNASVQLRMGVMPWQEGLEPRPAFERAWSACNLVRGKKTHLMVYNEEIHSHENYNHHLINDLRRALDEHEFKVYYQPKYHIQNEPPRLASAEALIRWQHPEMGIIPPSDFISLFEESGHISEVDKYVWAETARQIGVWKEKYGVTVPVSVNLSRVDAFDPDLVDILDRLVEENGLEPGSLKLEVTESAYTENPDQLLAVMEQLRHKGYEIEMDDFGSGYSSLGTLSTLPVDILKMDRSFVMHIDKNEKDLRLVELILDIAKNLKLPVIAEGVETEKQLTLLKNAGCEYVQGYYFSRPVPPEEFEEFIKRARMVNTDIKAFV